MVVKFSVSTTRARSVLANHVVCALQNVFSDSWIIERSTMAVGNYGVLSMNIAYTKPIPVPLNVRQRGYFGIE
ncbi:hypothetical protein TKK_0009207 [Trichogramma kaykai]